MLTQTIALFLDAYRELNAKKLFWITLVLSAVVVLVLACLGIDERGVSILVWRMGWLPLNTSMMSRETFYTLIFSNLGIGIWLSWVATILALVSTAGIVPELVTGGTIETVLSKPIGRVRLLLTKLATGLLFVSLQVFVFSLGCFLTFGLRAGVWNFGLFLAVPIVVLFYSYLYCVLAFLGMMTRSTVAALLLTMLLWGGLWVINTGDKVVMSFAERQNMIVETRQGRVERMEANTIKLVKAQHTDTPDYHPTDEELLAQNPFLASQRAKLESNLETQRELRFWTRLIVGVKSTLPKTGETIALLERHLINMDDMPKPESDGGETQIDDPDEDIQVDQQQLSQRLEERMRSRPVWWIVGTSLLFELVVTGITCIVFVRRDF